MSVPVSGLTPSNARVPGGAVSTPRGPACIAGVRSGARTSEFRAAGPPSDTGADLIARVDVNVESGEQRSFSVDAPVLPPPAGLLSNAATEVRSPGDFTFRAGVGIVLLNGFSVQQKS